MLYHTKRLHRQKGHQVSKNMHANVLFFVEIMLHVAPTIEGSKAENQGNDQAEAVLQAVHAKADIAQKGSCIKLILKTLSCQGEYRREACQNGAKANGRNGGDGLVSMFF